jgi:glycosyltransferase involved in cell wall biosynthesis
MQFSLVLGTIERVQKLEHFLKSLDAQSCRDFELIIVDQNPDDRLVALIQSFGYCFPIIHLRSEKGLSRARNVGLAEVIGEIVAFPDDDCWYPPDLLARVSEFFRNSPCWEGLTGRATDAEGRSSMGRFDHRSGPITYFSVWRRLTSFSIFLRSRLVRETGRFDETLGVGSGTPWGSAEEMDYIIRALKGGTQIYYDPDLIVYHPLTVEDFDFRAKRRHLVYGRGMGRVLRIQRYPLWFVTWMLIRPLGGAMIASSSLNFRRAHYHLGGFWGRLCGWLSKP